MGLNRIFLSMSKANASAGRIAQVIAAGEALPQLPPDQAAHTDSDAYILFDDVCFRYGQDGGENRAERMSLEHVSFSVKKGGSLGILGPTGCGKTTIVNLLMRFYDPTCGHVFLDGQDVRTYDKDALRRRFGVVFQSDAIFADTLEENISFGRDLDPEQLRAAARDACAAEFVEAYDDQYQHRASIHGADLSGGQRQRILISRALAADPDILILDDASSALDYKTDAAVRRAIRESHRDTTAIIVAQRVSSILSLDQILVLDEGRIIGQGTHQELLDSCPPYREICKIQMGEEG
jgi:ATP-binding cassette subfamily B protein